MNLMFAMLQAQGGGYSFFIMIGLMLVVMYFFMIRPQNKRQKEIQNFRNSLERGARVVTAGGIYGTVRDINDGDNTVSLEVAPNVKITVDKSQIYKTAADTANQK